MPYTYLGEGLLTQCSICTVVAHHCVSVCLGVRKFATYKFSGITTIAVDTAVDIPAWLNIA